MTTVPDCYSCIQEAKGDEASLWERIAGDDHWRVAHVFDTALPGWLVLLPRRHVTSIADLTDAEAATLGSWQVRLSRALVEVTGCERTYVAQFAEKAGFSHVHFHVVPRPADLPPELRGPRVFQLLGPADREHVAGAQLTDLAARLARWLRDSP
jgi:diadenosine tetraphosphate (Ap4A) HIT family hydrolase